MSSLLSRRNHDGGLKTQTRKKKNFAVVFNALFFRKVMEQEVQSIVKLERHQPSKTSTRVAAERERKIEWKNFERSRKQKQQKLPNYSCRFSFFSLLRRLLHFNLLQLPQLTFIIVIRPSDECGAWQAKEEVEKVDLKEEKKEKEKRFQNGMQCNFAAG